MTELFSLPFLPILNLRGLPSAGAKAFFYLSGTSTLSPVYVDAGKIVQLPNPVVSDNMGRLPDIYLDADVPAYRVRIVDAKGAFLAEVDPYIPLMAGPPGPPGGNVMSVGPFSALVSMAIPNGTDLIQTSGVTRGVLIADTSLTDADVTAHPLAIVKTTNGRFFRRDERDLRMEQFGAIADWTGTAGTDNLAAHNAAIAYIRRCSVNPFQGLRGGPRLRLANGTCYLSDTWDTKGVTCIIEGDGSTVAGAETSMLIFAANKTGIRLQRSNTEGEGIGTTIPFGNDGMVLRNFTIRSRGGAGAFYGIRARCRFEAHGIKVQLFPSHGIYVLATAGAGGAAEGNANNFLIVGGVSESNGGDGLHAEGADANAGNIIGLDCRNNTGWGFADRSFLGNTYMGCHTAGNVAGPYTCDNANASNSYLNCYSESDQGPSILAAPALVVGGKHAAGVSGTAVYIENAFGLMKTRGTVSSATGTTDTVTVQTGGDGDGGIIQAAFSSTLSSSAPYNQRFAGKDWVEGIGSLGADVSHLWTGVGTAYAFGRSSGQANVHSYKQIALGPDLNGRIITTDAAIPTTGNHARGEIVFNQSPTAGGKVGWVCVTAGTPGTWKAFGAIDA